MDYKITYVKDKINKHVFTDIGFKFIKDEVYPFEEIQNYAADNCYVFENYIDRLFIRRYDETLMLKAKRV
jgi:hypothetical protein